MATKSATYKVGDKVSGMYCGDRGGSCLDFSGIITAIHDGRATVSFSNGRESTYTLPASDYLDHLRICTACAKPTMFNHCIGNGGCGAPTEAA